MFFSSKIRISVLAVLMLWTLSLSAQRRIEADFVQTRWLSAFTEPMVQKGEFLYLAPDSVRWTYQGQHPVQMPEQMAKLIFLTAQGDTTSLKSVFRITQQGQTITLHPLRKQLQRIFSEMRITLGKLGAAEHVTMLEPTGDRTEIEFRNIKVEK